MLPHSCQQSLYTGQSHLVSVPALQDPSTDRAALVMNVTCQPGAEVSVDALLAAARAKLPAYMVPTSVRVLSQMPRLPNGKVGAGPPAGAARCTAACFNAARGPMDHWAAAYTTASLITTCTQGRYAAQIARLALPRHSIDMVDMGEYVAPINRIEQVIQAAWEEVLSVEPGSIGTQMSFFEVRLASTLYLHLEYPGCSKPEPCAACCCSRETAHMACTAY